MSWNGTASDQRSKMFRAFLADVMANATPMYLGSDTFRAALYTDTVTPDNDVTSANSAYNAGQWVTANEQSDSGQWAAGGLALTGVVLNSSSPDVVFWDADDAVSGSSADLTGVVGCLVYDDQVAAPVPDQGVCFNYFGGANSVVAGTFSCIWNSLGIWRASL